MALVLSVLLYKSIRLHASKTAQMSSSPVTPTFLLDIDMCTFYGQDFDDLVSVFQSLRQSDSSIKSLIQKLVNPSMISTIKGLLETHPNARVCLYTKKSGIIRDRGAPPAMLKDGEVYVPSSMSLDDYLLLGESAISIQMHRPLHRLFMCREVVQEALGLSCLPELIITAVHKSVKRACINLLKPPTNPDFAFLWDDNAEVANDFHVIRVPEYRAVPKAIACLVEQDLQTVKLDRNENEDLVYFLMQAPSKHSSYDVDDEHLFVKKTSAHLVDWPKPNIPVITDELFAALVVCCYYYFSVCSH